MCDVLTGASGCPGSCPPISDRCSAKARARSVGPASLVIAPIYGFWMRPLLTMFPDDSVLGRWIRLADRVPQLGLPSRVCWLGYGDRARFGLEMNRLIGDKKVSAPVVLGRDHLDCGSVASPNRETEAMRDGSDAIADWPLLNFALNAVGGASWVSFHHGGGVGMGNSLHAGMVIVADGTQERAQRLQTVLTVDPGIGIVRHADAGYSEALDVAADQGIRMPSRDEL